MSVSAESLLDQVNKDELNCPACADQTMLLVQGCSTDEVPRGVQVTCPTCGFFLGGADPVQVEAAIRTLWDYLPAKD